MCGVLALLGSAPPTVVAACLRLLRARGPDDAPRALAVRVEGAGASPGGVTLGFTRLSINGLSEAGWQPMHGGQVSVVCNGEIYNWRALEEAYGLELPPGCSDCGVLGPLWEALDGDATAFARSLDGVFAFVLVDEKRGVVAVGRDPYGVRPLFQAEIFAPATSVPADTEAALLPSAGTEAGCATSPAGSTAAFLARVESWAGPCPTVKQLPDRVVAAAHLPSLPVSGPLPQHYPLLWSSELRAVLPAVDQAALLSHSGDPASPPPFSVSPFPPGTVRVFSLATGALLRTETYHAGPWAKSASFGYSAATMVEREAALKAGLAAAAASGAAAAPAAAASGFSTSSRTWPWPPALQAGAQAARAALREALEASVEKRLLSDVPVGALLSGGLDSSLIAAIAARKLAARGGGRLKTFSIGMPGSSDLAHARLAAAHIGSDHHEVVVSEEDFWAAVPAVVCAIESFDITSVRASVGNYLVARYVRQKTDVRVVLNGDGSDEASGSYLYFLSAPSDAAFEQEGLRLLRDLHAFDVLRSDRCVAAWGLEARTPFLDRQFVATYLSVATALRRPLRGGPAEKQLLREAFDEPGHGYLPAAVLWRRKEAFSDGVSAAAAEGGSGKAWFQVVQERVASEVLPGQGDGADAAWRVACARYAAAAALQLPQSDAPPPVPFTRESLWYRVLFEQAFSRHACTVIPYFWLPRWSGGATDPSARTLAVYAAEESKVMDRAST